MQCNLIQHEEIVVTVYISIQTQGRNMPFWCQTLTNRRTDNFESKWHCTNTITKRYKLECLNEQQNGKLLFAKSVIVCSIKFCINSYRSTPFKAKGTNKQTKTISISQVHRLHLL